MEKPQVINYNEAWAKEVGQERFLKVYDKDHPHHEHAKKWAEKFYKK